MVDNISFSEGTGHRKHFRVVASNCIMCRYKHVCGYVQRSAIHRWWVQGETTLCWLKVVFYCLEVLCGSY